MKKTLTTLIATFVATVSLQAHCGSCSMDEMQGDKHANHAACYEGTLNDYFTIQKALAGDDLAAAKSSAKSLAAALADSECAAEGDDCCTEVSGASEAIANAANIAAARKAFEGFSKAMIAQMESHGSEQTVYQMYCPMAFNNKGAAWLQDNKSLRNPYFGASMLTCGTTKATYGKEADSHADHHEHSGHSH